MNKKIAIVMGSDSDLKVVKKVTEKLKEFGVDYEIHIMSAHRTPKITCEFAAKAEASNFGVIIAAAGMAAHLAGAMAAHTSLPVIGLPIKSSLDGLDALLATVQMPPGIPVATVGIDSAENAAILAVQILAISNIDLSNKLKAFKEQMIQKVIAKDIKLQEEVKSWKN
ncbi:MAG: 5-(carboxyamino)imidazole ribonucleotide mutase [Firmicutes bacterium]|nr:5-(carboxyamino)imidazole ribonucleotide mutase [Bacillota bacterium]